MAHLGTASIFIYGVLLAAFAVATRRRPVLGLGETTITSSKVALYSGIVLGPPIRRATWSDAWSHLKTLFVPARSA